VQVPRQRAHRLDSSRQPTPHFLSQQSFAKIYHFATNGAHFPRRSFREPLTRTCRRAVGDDGFRDSGAAPALHGAFTSRHHPRRPDPPSNPGPALPRWNPRRCWISFPFPPRLNLASHFQRRGEKSDAVRAPGSSSSEVSAHDYISSPTVDARSGPKHPRRPRMPPTGRARSVPPKSLSVPPISPHINPSISPQSISTQTTATCATTPRCRS